MKRRYLIFALLLSAFIFKPVANIYAKPAKEEKKMEAASDVNGQGAALKELLGLSDEQEKKMQEDGINQRVKIREILISINQARQALRLALQDYNSSQDEVKSAAQKVKDAESKLIDHQVNSILDIRAILNEEQYDKFKETLAKDAAQNNKAP